MFSKTKIALSAAIVLSAAFAASAATKPTQVSGSAFYTMIPSYDRNGGVVAVTTRTIPVSPNWLATGPPSTIKSTTCLNG
jgi:hypothetical protein